MKYLFPVLFLFYCSTCFGQQPTQTRFGAYYQSAQKAAMSGKLDQALIYGDSMILISKEYDYVQGVLIGISLQGKIYQAKGNTTKAYQAYIDALSLVDGVAANDSDFHKNNTKANIYKDLIKLFHRQNKIDSTNVYFNKINELPCEEGTLWAKDYVVTLLRERRDFKGALQVCQQVLSCYSVSDSNQYLLPKVLQSLVNIYNELGDHETAILYLDSTLQLAEKTKDSIVTMFGYQQLSIEHSAMGNYKEALRWAKKSVQLGEQLPSLKAIKRVSTIVVIVPLSSLYANLSQIYDKLNIIDSSKYYTQKSLLASYQTSDYENIASQLTHLANFMIEEGGNYSSAIDSLNKAYEVAPRYKNWLLIQLDIYLAKGNAYSKQNKMDSTLHYYAKAEITAKQLGVDNKLAATYEQIESFYTKQKDYQKAYQYQTLKIEQEENVRTKENQNAILRFEIKYESEKLKQENLLLAQTQKSQAQELAFKEALNQRNQYIILGLIALMLLLIGVAWLIYRQKNLQTQFSIMSLEQKALKAQINPHFFFNVLNSLQGTILSEEPMVAYKYHTKFTKLMRLILTQSDKDGISLKEEIEALQLYLELEQLRTGTAFEFEIVNTIELNDQLIVPSMLLQPFVENAIWHGVMNRAEGEEKKITIHLKTKENLILCEILDTGVGRKQANIIKQQKTTMHESMGMKVTQNRLELFQLRYKMPLSFSIQDLIHSNGAALGTKVEVEIPNIHNS